MKNNFTYDDELYHYGVKGMKWHKRKAGRKVAGRGEESGGKYDDSGYTNYRPVERGGKNLEDSYNHREGEPGRTAQYTNQYYRNKRYAGRNRQNGSLGSSRFNEGVPKSLHRTSVGQSYNTSGRSKGAVGRTTSGASKGAVGRTTSGSSVGAIDRTTSGSSKGAKRRRSKKNG